MTMINQLQTDCRNWIASLTKVILNKREMQVRLAMHLKALGHYDNVFVDYYVPFSILPSPYYSECPEQNPLFPWKNNIYFDIVVEKDHKFALIELKYATIAISEQPKIFNISIPLKDINLFKLYVMFKGMYDYWKYIRMIEAMTHIQGVVGGVAIILTNNSLFWQPPKHNPKYLPFSIHENRKINGPVTLSRGNKDSDAMSAIHPDFVIEGKYVCHWDDTNILYTDSVKRANEETENPKRFRYMITEIDSTEVGIENSQSND